MLANAVKPAVPDRSAVEEELRRLIASPGLAHSESLCQLLNHLVQHALDKPHQPITEYQLAAHVFGRGHSFDPRLDSTVRVQTSRLRNKLIEYYGARGSGDTVVIEIPKGTYSAVFRLHTPEPPPRPESKEPKASAIRPWVPTISILGGLIAGLAAGLLASSLQRPALPKGSGDTAEVRGFWNSVLKNPEAPLLVFSNAEFNGRPETGLRYFNPKSDSRDHVNDLYTGVGEVLAIAELSKIFRLVNRDVVVKRSGLLNWDETRSRDLIFAGSPTENLSLRDLPLSQEFVFRRMQPEDARAGDLAIVNEHPRPGEPALFLASADLPLTEDYALLILQSGPHPAQSVLLMAGTTTLGTQAAGEFVSQNESLASLRKSLGLAPRSPYTPFSAVLHVRIARGVPVETRLAAVHALGQ